MRDAAFTLDAMLAAHAGRSDVEHLRSGSLSMGTSRLPAGAQDPQRPHGEDEVYLVVRGRATLRVGARVHAVGPGSVVFVPARAEHRFEAIAEDLEALVLFAPPEGGAAGKP